MPNMHAIAAKLPGRKRLGRYLAQAGVKPTDGAIARLRAATKEVDAVRAQRRLLKQTARDPLAGRRPGYALANHRATKRAARERKARTERDERDRQRLTEVVCRLNRWLRRPSRNTSQKIEAKRIVEQCRYLSAEDVAEHIPAVACETLAHWLCFHARNRWNFDARSQSRSIHGCGHSVYVIGEHHGKAIRLRISDHLLPETEERRYNHGLYGRSFDAEVILTVRDEWADALRKFAESMEH